jgi:hypothetical protein
MLRRYKALLLVFALLPGPALAQPEMPLLVPGEIPGLEVRSVRSFAGDALYGYIDGGADLYHEYGFERLSVQELGLDEETYFSEVYRMADPGGAFGMFSISHRECAQADSLPPSSCVAPFVVQWARSQYFVRIAGASRTPSAQVGVLLLARTLAAKISGESWRIPPLPAAAGGNERTLLLVRGVLGMQNGFDQWSRLVEGLENFEAAIVSREDSTGQTVVGEFRFASAADLERFSGALAGGGRHVRPMQVSGHRLLVMESDAPADLLWSKLIKLPWD